MYLYVGTWKLFGGKGDGIYVYKQNPDDGSLAFVHRQDTVGNTSMLCISPDSRYLYAVDERKDFDGVYALGGGVESYGIEPKSQMMTLLSRQLSYGSCPAFISVSPNGDYAAVANHGTNPCMATRIVRSEDGTFSVKRVPDTASVVLFPIDPQGRIMPACDVFISEGEDPEKPAHCHSVYFSRDGKRLFACDKGLSRIYVFTIDKENNKLILENSSPYLCRKDSRTRHMAFHPERDLIFTSNEYEYSLSSYSVDHATGIIKELDSKSTIPGEFIQGRDIRPGTVDVRVHPNGRFVYVSNRTTNNGITSASSAPVTRDYPNGSIAIFGVDTSNGKLDLLAWQQLRCGNPRSFELSPDGRFLYVADLDRDTITKYEIDSDSGLLFSETVAAKVPSPSDLVFHE